MGLAPGLQVWGHAAIVAASTPTVPLAQMAPPGSVPGSAPFIITNEGAQPAGYIYLGANHGASIWGRADAVDASLPAGRGDTGTS